MHLGKDPEILLCEDAIFMKKFLQRQIPLLLVVSVLVALFIAPVHASAQITSGTQQVDVGGSTRSANLIWVDLSNPNIRVQNAIPNNRLLTAAPLGTIAESTRQPGDRAIAAVNGYYFDPVGTGYTGSNNFYGIIKNGGNFIQTSGSNVVMGFTPDNDVRLGTVDLTVRVHRENAGRGEPPMIAWSLNHAFGDAGARSVYTSAFGARTPSNTARSIVVRNGVVTDIVNGPAPIHADGFTIAGNSNAPSANDPMFRYLIGERAWFTVDYSDQTWRNYSTMIAGGPILVEGGNIRTDLMEQGYNAPIVNNSLQRSFIGITADRRLFMGTVSNVTMAGLARAAQSLGAVYAMNLDGGASSGLYLNGSYITRPGRNIVTAIVFAEGETPAVPITVLLNGEALSFDVPAQMINNRVMLPMRGIFEAMGAEVRWNGETQTVTATKDNTTVAFTIGSSYPTVNGVTVPIDQPGVIVRGTTLAPLRFVAEAFGGSVRWDGEARTAQITMQPSR